MIQLSGLNMIQFDCSTSVRFGDLKKINLEEKWR